MIRLRPLVVADAVVLESQDEPEAAGTYGWFGFRDGRLKRRIESAETLTGDHGVLAVADEAGALLGDVSWHRRDNAQPPNGACWNIGVWLRPEARGKGYGAQAQRLLVEYLFAHTTMHRIEASTEADNVAEQRALERAGFTREGVQRGAVFRDGAYRDMVMFSILRDEL